ncbi:MAG: hypothetical protein ACHQNE_09095 [Candidatus Kapaibacterium sp.]
MPSDSQPVPASPPADLVRVQLSEEDLSFETIKSAIYAQARYLFERNQPIAKLLLSKDLFEILNRRLVFKTAAHKDAPHFITPYGNLEVEAMNEGLDEARSFIVS